MIRELISTGRADTVVVSGNSGLSIGVAALSMEDFPLVLVRKDNDNSHGSPIEGPDRHHMRRYIILDDFIDSGATIERIVNKINVLSCNYHDRPECTGVVLYKRAHNEHYRLECGRTIPVLGCM
jgi:adenine/guanine phosphoribosyltransferase-like PRPP-binding protein